MSSVYKKIKDKRSAYTCMAFKKDQLIDAARYAKLSTSGTKSDLCVKILQKIRHELEPQAKPQAKPAAVPQVVAKPQGQEPNHPLQG